MKAHEINNIINHYTDVNVGDIITCKKSIPTKDSNLITEGKSYKVISKTDPLWIVILLDDDSELNISISSFSSASPFMYCDFFYTKQEHRKLKLKNLKYL